MRSRFGQTQNRYLHDVTVCRDDTRRYLAHWDAGPILLDMSDLYVQVETARFDRTGEELGEQDGGIQDA